MRIYNTLTRRIEEFKPIDPPNVGFYGCGPTVYYNVHIGHLRRYVGDDVLRRALTANGFAVKYVMNITDVGHLTSDADTGEDKVEKTARETGKSAWEIAKFYENQFFSSIRALNIKMPDVICRATEHINEQIDLIKKLERKGYTYKTSDGIYFDTSKLSDYGKLVGSKEGIMPGARIDLAEKKNQTDFALWKFSPKDQKRQMEWESPWGTGFPGWHIECAAMSMKYLGESFDIHSGGVDHIPIHHTNEIAESEAATGKPFVRYWIHHEFLQIEGQKMSKSLKNLFTIDDVVKKGYDPLSLRYLYLTAHYRDPLNFTWEALTAAENAYEKLKEFAAGLSKIDSLRTTLSNEKLKKISSYQFRFMQEINNDLSTPKALAVVWEMVKSNIPSEDKKDLIFSFDQILGLGLGELKEEIEVPKEVEELVEERERLRAQKLWDKADYVREKIEKFGYRIEDTPSGPRIRKI